MIAQYRIVPVPQENSMAIQNAYLEYVKISSIMEQDTSTDKNHQACYGGRQCDQAKEG
uniref:Uncharacterized protein n=1 Tax=Helianthus annuus TaxID=4232 RepID=A0A251U3A7_HELAN